MAEGIGKQRKKRKKNSDEFILNNTNTNYALSS